MEYLLWLLIFNQLNLTPIVTQDTLLERSLVFILFMLVPLGAK